MSIDYGDPRFPSASYSGGSLTVAAERLPHLILAEIFDYLPLSAIGACMRVCRHWAHFLSFEDGNVWQRLCNDTLPSVALTDAYLLRDVQSAKAKLRSFMYAWNPQDLSRNAFVKSNGYTLHRNPIAQSTDGCRAKLGMNTGRHAWQVQWEGPLGTVAVIGIATRHAAMQCPSYMPLLGSDDQGWAWNLVDCTLTHNGSVLMKYPEDETSMPAYQVGDKIRVILDCDEHHLYFEYGDNFLGVAFEELPPVKLYPAVCAVYGNTEVTMVYLGAPVDG